MPVTKATTSRSTRKRVRANAPAFTEAEDKAVVDYIKQNADKAGKVQLATDKFWKDMVSNTEGAKPIFFRSWAEVKERYEEHLDPALKANKEKGKTGGAAKATKIKPGALKVPKPEVDLSGSSSDDEPDLLGQSFSQLRGAKLEQSVNAGTSGGSTLFSDDEDAGQSQNNSSKADKTSHVVPGTTGGVERQGAFQIILIGFLVVLLVAILTADRWGGITAARSETIHSNSTSRILIALSTLYAYLLWKRVTWG